MNTGTPKKMQFINLTGHPINIYNTKGDTPRLLITIPPSGMVFRTDYVTHNEKYLDMGTGNIEDNIPLSINTYCVKDIPERKNNTIYIVPWLVAREMPNRWDIRFPNGQFKLPDGTRGCVSLGRYRKKESVKLYIKP